MRQWIQKLQKKNQRCQEKSVYLQVLIRLGALSRKTLQILFQHLNLPAVSEDLLASFDQLRNNKSMLNDGWGLQLSANVSPFTRWLTFMTLRPTNSRWWLAYKHSRF